MNPKLVAVARAEPDAEGVEEHIPGYELLDVIGEGASSIVYRGNQCSVGRLVAVKILRAFGTSSAQMEHRFVREARIIGRLRHPNTIRLYDAGRTNTGALYLVT